MPYMCVYILIIKYYLCVCLCPKLLSRPIKHISKQTSKPAIQHNYNDNNNNNACVCVCECKCTKSSQLAKHCNMNATLTPPQFDEIGKMQKSPLKAVPCGFISSVRSYLSTTNPMHTITCIFNHINVSVSVGEYWCDRRYVWLYTFAQIYAAHTYKLT